jgi:hypothetical protein
MMMKYPKAWGPVDEWADLLVFGALVVALVFFILLWIFL